MRTRTGGRGRWILRGGLRAGALLGVRVVSVGGCGDGYGEEGRGERVGEERGGSEMGEEVYGRCGWMDEQFGDLLAVRE
jgi:hypothetical protein